MITLSSATAAEIWVYLAFFMAKHVTNFESTPGFGTWGVLKYGNPATIFPLITSITWITVGYPQVHLLDLLVGGNILARAPPRSTAQQD
jgi:hypothetical protein